ncbi:MAG TPA: N-6 DNA methylase [Candidatus Limnocylindrales bacterium]
MKPTPSADKLRGGYYTPSAIARFLATWAISAPTATVLEPSAGDGAFLKAAAERLIELGGATQRLGITAVEVDPTAAQEARWTLAPFGLDGAVVEGDFFAFAESLPGRQRFDAVVGNPPFLRFHNFREEHREPAFRLMRDSGLHPSRLTNAWVPFVVAASSMLGDRGRMAMVVPAELLQVGYAAELREFLSREFTRITVIAFDSLVFDDIQQEVVLLLAEKESDAHPGIRVIELRDASELARIDPSRDAPVKELDHTKEKWTQYFLEAEELAALRGVRESGALSTLGTLASVDIGVVTGNNDFFLVPAQDEFSLAGLSGYLWPIVTRSRQVRGLEFNAADWLASEAEGLARHLLVIGIDDPIPDELQVFLDTGVAARVPEGYKCRIRKKWYVVPSVHRADGLLLRQIHSHPQIAINATGVTSTDTVHRVKFRQGTDRRSLVAGFHNSLTFAFAEVMGRSYGGGVLELEPSEADGLPVPYHPKLAEAFEAIDKALRLGDIDNVLDVADRAAAAVVDVAPSQFTLLRRGWRRLRGRRLRRNGAGSHSELS